MDPRFEGLVQSGATERAAAALEKAVREGADRDLFRINTLEFASEHGLEENEAIDAFLHALKLGLFDLSWDLTCPQCGAVIDAASTLKQVTKDQYPCTVCATNYPATTDEMIEANFTVSPRVRKIAEHDPDSLTVLQYYASHTYGSRVRLPKDTDWQALHAELVIDGEPVPAGEKVILSVQLPNEPMLLVFEPVVHAVTLINVQGEPARERQEATLTFTRGGSSPPEVTLRPGPCRFVLQNKSDKRIYPGVLRKGSDPFMKLVQTKRRFLTARRLMTNQTFFDLFHTDALDIDQRLKVTKLTVLFTDLKGSTELYERVGDLVAYDLVKKHFGVLGEVIRKHGGSLVKTIGDAVMATYDSPERGMASALEMRKAMMDFNAQNRPGDLTVKIGLHEGPCLAVVLNERMDYFGQAVNIAARVQGLASAQSIFTTEPVVRDEEVGKLLGARGLQPMPQKAMLKGIKEELLVYEIP
jgi:class 3 adenylate cyclase